MADFAIVDILSNSWQKCFLINQSTQNVTKQEGATASVIF